MKMAVKKERTWVHHCVKSVAWGSLIIAKFGVARVAQFFLAIRMAEWPFWSGFLKICLAKVLMANMAIQG